MSVYSLSEEANGINWLMSRIDQNINNYFYDEYYIFVGNGNIYIHRLYNRVKFIIQVITKYY